MTALERAYRGARADLRLHLLSVFSVAVAFVCLGSALLIAVNVDAVRTRWSSTGRASVYLRPNVEREKVRAIEEALRKTEGVADLRFVSSDQARQEVLAGGSEETLSALPAEAFPASIELKLSDEAAAERLERLSAQLDVLPEVEAVETYEAWSEKLSRLLAAGVAAALLLTLVVLGAVVSVVSSTIRLSLQRRQIEVEVLSLVGATANYVRRPFVIEGAAQGALGALLAVVLLGALYLMVAGQFESSLGTLLGMSPRFLPLTWVVAFVSCGAGLGAGAAYLSLRRLWVRG